MKHDQLKSIAHNIAASLASGIGIPIGYCHSDVFAESKKNSQGFINVDFLKGTTSNPFASDSLIGAIKLYHGALEELCKKHGTSILSFRKLEARYSNTGLDYKTIVTIEDDRGQISVDEYTGPELRRIKIIDNLGRIRTEH